MKQIWLIGCNAPDNILDILDEAFSSLEKGRGIYPLPFGTGVMTPHKEDIIYNYIHSVVPAIDLHDVYFEYDW